MISPQIPSFLPSSTSVSSGPLVSHAPASPLGPMASVVDGFVSASNSDRSTSKCEGSVLTPIAFDKNTIRSSSSRANPSPYFQSKPIVDRLLTLVIMLVAAPTMLIVSLAIWILDGRPIFFHQTRVGKDGRHFRIRKFRTMQHDAERRTGAVWSTKHDVRVTRLGRWLRCSHLDELPQLLNVLAGEMSLVGPRPERPEFVAALAQEVPGYIKRTRVRPGITGLAQLHLGYDQSFAGIPQKVSHDLEYICGATFSGDVALLAKTLPHIAWELHSRWIGKPLSVAEQMSPSIHIRDTDTLGVRDNHSPLSKTNSFHSSADLIEGEVA